MEDVVMNSERFKIQNSLEANYLCVEMREPAGCDSYEGVEGRLSRFFNPLSGKNDK